MIKKSICLILLWAIGTSAFAQKKKISLRDSVDGKLDASEFLEQVYGFVPIVMPVTEPALGFGAAGGLLFVQRKKDDSGDQVNTPPDLYGIGGMYTETQSWAIGGGYFGHWNQDKIRTNIVAAYGSLNLTYYRELPVIGDVGFGMNLSSSFFQFDMSRRLGKIPLFAGLRYTFAGTTVDFDLGDGSNIPGVEDFELNFNIGGVAPLLTWDSRDNIFTPDNGIKMDFQWNFNNEAFGSDSNFQRASLRAYGFKKLSPKLTGGLRMEIQGATDETPFYAYPYVFLRGIPAMRYQGSSVYVIETEERYNISNRWAVVGFGGLGKGVLPDSSWEDSTTAWSLGSGFRYLLAKVFNMYGGVDVARGNEDWAVYFIVGSYWGTL